MGMMIGYLRGKVLKVLANKLIIDCSGVGYLVNVATTQNYRLGEETEVFVHTYVKEDVLSLFGFESEESQSLFEKLLGVSGVGPKVALNVLKAGNPEEIGQAIKEARVDFFTKVPGIGKKGAQRIIVELKGKLDKDLVFEDSLERIDAMRGLMNLGYLKAEAVKALEQVDSNITAAEQIKLALKHG